MWKVRTKNVPVITVAQGTFKKRLDQNLQLLPRHLSATELQKITLLSTAHIIREVLR
jgi:diketogulonate reductase-like aldo/keto reductase